MASSPCVRVSAPAPVNCSRSRPRRAPAPSRVANLPHMLDVLASLRASLGDRYDVEREIGSGGMARVFLAVEQHPHRRVAIKVLDPDVSTRLLRERFIREVDLSSNLSHPHIVPIFSAGEAGGLFYYVMPYVEGESLRHRLLREKLGRSEERRVGKECRSRWS